MELIPAIDLLGGRAVRLRQGRYEEATVYSDAPEQLAREWSGRVARLHVVDLEGAKAGQPVQLEQVRRIVQAFGPGVQLGGGIRTIDAVRTFVDLGVSRLVLGTAAVRDPDFVARVAEAYPGRVILAVDARAGRVATSGWLEATELMAVDLVQQLRHLPLAAVLYTDIERDGTEVGPNVVETARLARETGAAVIASGGVGTLDHLRSLAQAGENIVGAIVGRALHENRFTLEQGIAATQS